MPDPTGRQRRRFRLSVRALMVVVLILGGGLGWVVLRARAQREVVAVILKAGGSVWYDDHWYDEIEEVMDADGRGARFGPKPKNWPPRWLVDSIGIDYFHSVVGVRFNEPGADEVASRVARLPRVDTIYFGYSDLSDSGLACLCSLTNLEVLLLTSTSVSDSGMAQVATLRKLERLSVGHTKVTDLGVASIVRLPALKELDLSETQVGDKSAALLASKAGLEEIYLFDTRVSPEAIETLRNAFPDADISSQ